MTYTIAYDQVLIACVPDGDHDAFQRELDNFEQQARAEIDPHSLVVEHGLTLTNEEPEDENRIVWRGHDLGWLTDTAGQPYKYAIR